MNEKWDAALQAVLLEIQNSRNLSNKSYESLTIIAAKMVKDILIQKGFKKSPDEIEDIICSSINKFYLHALKTGHEKKIEDPACYLYSICRNEVFQSSLQFNNHDYLYYSKIFTNSIQLLEKAGKIYSSKNRIAIAPELVNLDSSIELDKISQICYLFEVNSLFKEEKWTSERISELQQAIVFVLERIQTGIEINHIRDILGKRIGIDVISLGELLYKTEDGEKEPIEVATEETPPEIWFEYKQIFEKLKLEIIEFSESEKTGKQMLKFWALYNLENKTLREIATQFGLKGTSNVDYYLNKSSLTSLFANVGQKIITLSNIESQMKQIVMQFYEDLRQFLPKVLGRED